MAPVGILLNAVTTGLAAACFLGVAFAVGRRKARRKSSLAAPLFLGTVGLFLALAAMRQLAAFSGSLPLERLIHHLLIPPAAFAIVPLVHLVTMLVSGSRRVAYATSAVFAAAAAIGVAFAYAGGFGGPFTSPWGSEWTIHSNVAKAMILLVLTLPGIVAGIVLLAIGRRMPDDTGRRASLVGTMCIVYYLVFTFDAFGLEGLHLLLARVITAATALMAYEAYFPRAKPADARGPNDAALTRTP